MKKILDISALSNDELDTLLVKARRLAPKSMNLFDIPGYPFGFPHYVEREWIKRNIINSSACEIDPRQISFEITRIQQDIHKNDLSYREYQPLLMNINPVQTNVEFTIDELQHIIDHFENANDPFVISLVEKARIMRDKINI